MKLPSRLSALGPAVVLVLASGLAAAGMRGPARPVVGFSVAADSAVSGDCEPTDDPTEEPVAGPTVAPSPTTGPTCEPPEDGNGDGAGNGDGDENGAVTEDPAARVATCEEAAGQSSEGGEGNLVGLDRAIERVLENCIKNAQAPGLVNALEHLALNRERKEDREDAREGSPGGGPPAGVGGGPPDHAQGGGSGKGNSP